MEQNLNKQFENQDPWRNAILVERENPGYTRILVEALKNYSGPRSNALILGDASLRQAEYLLEKEKFEHVIDVDSSLTLLDDVIIKKGDSRLDRVLLSFDQYDPSLEKFDLIYGKSIAFNSKNTIAVVLERLTNSLSDQGLFYAVFAGPKDSYRHGIFYIKEELENLYKEAGLNILEIKETSNTVPGLLGRKGIKHEFKILATK